MNNLSPHAQRVLDWRESLSVLQENQFFELIRMYLGNVKTPFSKQKLIEELGSFLRKEENQKLIFSLLDETEIHILAAIKFIEKATCEKILSFFGEEFSYAIIYDKILNLEERLLAYTYTDKNTKEKYLRLNPMFDSTFETLLTENLLLEGPCLAEKLFDPPEIVSPELMAAFVSFVFENKDLVKADGTFKKRTVTDIEERFHGKEEVLHGLLNGFLNLGLIIETDKGFEIDRDRINSFASLPELTQRLYLSVSSKSRFSRSDIVRQANLLFDTVSSIPENGYTKRILLRSAYLFSEKENAVPGLSSLGSRGRFSSIMNRAGGYSNASNGGIENFIESAVNFGIIEILGKTETGEDILVKGSVLKEGKSAALRTYGKRNSKAEDNSKKGILTVDSNLCIRLLPGLSFSELLSLVDFMELRSFDTAATFEITKQSIMRGFDFGLTTENIFSMLEKYSSYEIPQNLKFSIDDWYKSYSSATIFKGYVLRVSPEKINLVEMNPRIKKYVSETLAPGVYLLSVSSDSEAERVVSRWGFDFVGKVKTSERPAIKMGFPDLFLDFSMIKENVPSEEENGFTVDMEHIENHQKEMEDALNQLRIPDDQKEGLLLRIKRKIILSPVQLRGETVRFERTEAGGIDFSGKLHVIDSAINSSSMLTVEFSNPDFSKNESKEILGKPLALEKSGTVAYLRILVEPEKDERVFEVGRISFVKKIRGSIFC